MDILSRVNSALKQAMKDKAATRLSTLRLITAAVKDKEIAARGKVQDGEFAITDADVLAILGKMTKQRLESIRAYEEGGRIDLAEREQEEIEIIQEFLPKQLASDEVATAIAKAVETTGAGSIRDMGKVMAELKGKYTGRMDFGKVGPMVKDQLCSGSANC